MTTRAPAAKNSANASKDKRLAVPMSGSLSTSTAMIATGTHSGTSPRDSDVIRSPRADSIAER